MADRHIYIHRGKGRDSSDADLRDAIRGIRALIQQAKSLPNDYRRPVIGALEKELDSVLSRTVR